MSIIVQRLWAGERSTIRRHLRELPAADRRLRFGSTLGNEAIDDYVVRIDFDRDAVFAIRDADRSAVGLVHVAFQVDHAELGLSVLPAHRGRGAGAALFERAVTHARNRCVSGVLMRCLPENAAIARLARSCGMTIVGDGEESCARLEVPPASPASMAAECAADGVAWFDDLLKLSLAAAATVVRLQRTSEPSLRRRLTRGHKAAVPRAREPGERRKRATAAPVHGV